MKRGERVQEEVRESLTVIVGVIGSLELSSD